MFVTITIQNENGIELLSHRNTTDNGFNSWRRLEIWKQDTRIQFIQYKVAFWKMGDSSISSDICRSM